VSLFRPARVVTGPDGRLWEVYVSRFQTPGWKPSHYTSPADDFGGAFYLARLMVLFLVVEIPLFVLHQLLWPLVRFVLLLPFTLARGLGAREVRIEAVTFYPWPESHLWVTARDRVGEVLEQVVRDLRVGDVAHPLAAEFRGSRQLVGGTYRGLARDE
jgi:hypothetical protein